jgi:transposase
VERMGYVGVLKSTSDLLEHYNRALCLAKSPWSVVSVKQELHAKILTLEIKWSTGVQVPCPECERLCPIHDHREVREWRHLDMLQFQTIIRSRIPRSQCESHGVRTIAIPWASQGARFSLSFESHAIDTLLAARTIKDATEMLGLSWDQAFLIQSQAVQRGLAIRENLPLSYVGIDEKSFSKGQSYASLLVDLNKHRVLEVIEGRTIEATDELWQKLSLDSRKMIDAVCMDMWDAFITSTKKNVTQASVVHDKFHVVKYLNAAVDKVRRAEHKELNRFGDETLKGAKYLFLKNPEKMTEAQSQRFKTLKGSNLKSARAWAIVETFTAFWEFTYVGAAKKFFSRWYFWATHSRLRPIILVARMLKRHLPNLLTYLQHPITNGMVEGFNSKIQNIKANARGYRNFENYRTAILFHCGGLALHPPSSLLP